MAQFDYHESKVGKIRKTKGREIEEKQSRIDHGNNSVTSCLENVPFSNRLPFSCHFRAARIRAYFERQRPDGEREREKEEKREKGRRVSRATREDNLTIRAKGRCCTRRCAIRFWYGNARLVLNAVLVGGGFRRCRVAARRIQPCATLSKYRSQFSPAK